MDTAKQAMQDLLKGDSQYFFITLSVIIFILILLFGWIYDRIGLKDRSCSKLDIYYSALTNKSYFNNGNSLRNKTIFDVSDSILINYYVKSAYNCCCGDGYKNNFVALCALEKCIKNGCRFLDFEIYSYNNEPIVASSTADNNYIKETYNSLSLEEVLTTITDHAFDATKTNCANDPLILNFRVMSTNLGMLEKIGELFERILDKNNDLEFGLLKQYNYANTNAILNIKMKELYRKIIISFDFNPNPSIVEQPKLTKLKSYINLLKGTNTRIYRYNHIIAKGENFTTETKSKFVIVLPNLDNSTQNFDSTISHNHGCQAICMKHQNLDNNLLGYNALFKNNENYSWKIKASTLLNLSAAPLATTTGLPIVAQVASGKATTWLTTEEGSKKPVCAVYNGTVLAKCGDKTVNIWGKGNGTIKEAKDMCNQRAKEGLREKDGVAQNIGYWGTCQEIYNEYEEFEAGNNINIGHLGGIELNSGHLSKSLKTSKPVCREAKGSVWAFCGDRTISRWGIDATNFPEEKDDTERLRRQTEKSIGDCNYAATNGSREDDQGETFDDGYWGTCGKLFDYVDYKEKLTYGTGINIATFGGPDPKPHRNLFQYRHP